MNGNPPKQRVLHYKLCVWPKIVSFNTLAVVLLVQHVKRPDMKYFSSIQFNIFNGWGTEKCGERERDHCNNNELCAFIFIFIVHIYDCE